MRVIGIPVISGAERDDRLQRAGRAGSDLKRIEAAPGDPEHAHGAIAPGLSREPGDYRDRIIVFSLRVLVECQSVGITRTANIDTDTGIAVASEIVVHGCVTAAHEIALAVGKVFEERRHRPVRRIRRQPDPSREPGPVRKWDPFVLDNSYRNWELGNGLHRASLS